jgi:hypothetical protein
MQKTMRQHYVPQCYLRRFCKEGQRFFAFDKITRKSFSTSVADIALQRNFYDLPEEPLKQAYPGEDIDVQLVEKAFSHMEGWSKGLFDELLAEIDRRGVIPRPLRLQLAPYVIIQLFRTRLFRDRLLETTLKTKELLAKQLVEQKIPGATKHVEIKVEFDPSLIPVLHAQRFFDEDLVVELAAIINQHIWFVGVNPTIQPYYTSDHPVVKKANREQPGRSFTGLRSPGIEISFPLSSRHILVMLERSHFQHIAKFDGRAQVMDPIGVEHFNALQVMRCQRQVYCETNQFEQAESVCRRFPEVCVLDRSWVQIIQKDDLFGMLFSD